MEKSESKEREDCADPRCFKRLGVGKGSIDCKMRLTLASYPTENAHMAT